MHKGKLPAGAWMRQNTGKQLGKGPRELLTFLSVGKAGALALVRELLPEVHHTAGPDKASPGNNNQLQVREIMEWLGLEGILNPIQFNPLTWAGMPPTTPGCSKPHPTRNGAATASLRTPFQPLTPKIPSQYPILNLYFVSLKPFLLVLNTSGCGCQASLSARFRAAGKE